MRLILVLGVSLYVVFTAHGIARHQEPSASKGNPSNGPTPSLSNKHPLNPSPVLKSDPARKAALSHAWPASNSQTGYYYPSTNYGAQNQYPYGTYYPGNQQIVNPQPPSLPPPVPYNPYAPAHPGVGHTVYPDCQICPQPENKCKWKLVFKAVSGNHRRVYEDYITAGSINGNSPDAKDITSTLVFRDGDILDNWNSRVIEKVKVEMFTAGERKVRLLYDGIGTDNNDWFSLNRLIVSPYKDLKSDLSLNFHSILGESAFERSFFINREYDGCPGDCGYIVVIDTRDAGHPCPWGQPTPKPIFRYGQLTDTCSKWQSESGLADRFLISVKECEEDW